MAKVMLAILIGSLPRRATPLEDAMTLATGQTPLTISIAATVASLLLLLVVFELIRSRRLRERYALLWLLTGVVLLVLSALARRPEHDRRAGSVSRRTRPPFCSPSRCCSCSPCCCTTRR